MPYALNKLCIGGAKLGKAPKERQRLPHSLCCFYSFGNPDGNPGGDIASACPEL